MVCKNQEYREFCNQTFKYLPACDEIDNVKPSDSLFAFPSLGETGLVLQAFELGRQLTEKKVIKFYPQGLCMYPCIRPGDTLHIEPRGIEGIKVGDIAVYRRRNRLFAHRTIEKKQDKGLDYIITRADTARFGNDGPSFDRDILGIVASIERRGKFLTPAKKGHTLIKRFFLNLGLQYYLLRQRLWSKIISIIIHSQQSRAYQMFAEFLFINSNKKIEFSLQAPANFKLNSRFIKRFSAGELFDSFKAGSGIFRWRIVLSINSKPVGHLAFIFRPKICPFSGCWLSEAKIRIRYRGTGIEKRLLGEADKLLSQMGINEIFASVFKNKYLEKTVFKQLGFKEKDNRKEAVSACAYKETIERIILKRMVAI